MNVKKAYIFAVRMLHVIIYLVVFIVSVTLALEEMELFVKVLLYSYIIIKVSE